MSLVHRNLPMTLEEIERRKLLRARIRQDNHKLRRNLARKSRRERRRMQLEDWIALIGIAMVLIAAFMMMWGKL